MTLPEGVEVERRKNVCSLHFGLSKEVRDLADLVKRLNGMIDEHLSPLLTFMNKTKGGTAIFSVLGLAFIGVILTIALIVKADTQEAAAKFEAITTERQKKHEDDVKHQIDEFRVIVDKFANSVQILSDTVHDIKIQQRELGQQQVDFLNNVNRNQADIQFLIKRLINQSKRDDYEDSNK